MPKLASGAFIRRVVVAVAALALLYVLALNVFLLTPLLRKVANSQGPVVHLAYDRAYSYAPGRVHVDGLELSGGDSHVQWCVKIDRASFALAPSSFWTKQFRTTWVEADGVSVRARLLSPRERPEHDRHVAEIPGFEGPPLAPIGPVELTPDVDALFSVDLEGVDALHVREIWVETLRFGGDAHVRGRWRFHPMKSLEIGPAHVDARLAELSEGRDAPAFRDLSASIDLTLDRMKVKEVPFDEVPRYATVGVDLDATTALSPLLAWLAPGAKVTADGALPMKLRAAIDHGVVRAGSSLDASGDAHVGVAAPPAAVRGELRAHLVAETFELTRPAVRLHDSTLVVEALEGTGLGAEIRAARVETSAGALLVDLSETPALDLAEASVGVTRAELLRGSESVVRAPSFSLGATRISRGALPLSGAFTFDVPELSVPSLARLGAWIGLPSGLSVASGSGTVSAHGGVDLATRTLDGSVRTRASRLGLRVADRDVVLDADVDVRARPSYSKRTTGLDGSHVALEHVATGDVRDWWANVTLHDAHAKLSDDGFRIDAAAHVDSRDAVPIMAMVSHAVGVPQWLLAMLSMPGMRGDARIHATKHELLVRGLRVDGGDSHVRAVAEEQPSRHHEALLIDKGPLAVGLEMKQHSMPKVVLADAASWFYRTNAYDDGTSSGEAPPLGPR